MAGIKIPPAHMGMTHEEDIKWFEAMCSELATQAETKREAYGENLSNSRKFLEVLYPEGIPPSAYHEAMVMLRIFDKFCRRANKHRDPKGWAEQENPWLDVAGYGIAMLYDTARGLVE